ncbi:MAG: hypothetical protein DM484_27845 [Candidatus Methylumidiphilus alinenensis]|uniref:Uncharacterized protein n=1 Tax=Candidatus Methylumidiphilus alinenensis TaxID=2202197 RepID=A0A2W4QK71_9GAMM|nr:MAG: hypothetical protein DM484_27845 [Candidatus Methylumidiphilus alinenensis]
MTIFGLSNYLGCDPRLRNDGTSALWEVGKGFKTPGFWVSLAAKARNEGVPYRQLRFSDDDGRRYSEAMKLQVVLDGVDDYPYSRRKQGQNYSPLVLLENEESTDSATQTVNGCIRNHFAGLGFDAFTDKLCGVVGDLHDNVWSHGKSTGFSMAQKWKKPRSTNDVMFEFALADCGLGFLRELSRVGLKIEDDAEAIEWCIVKGHSSKLVNEKQDDGWAQRLPPDLMGCPMPIGVGRVKESDNHHQGLGLAKLISLVDEYKGSLWLATGRAMLTMKPEKSEFISLKFPWKGVCIACRFDGSLVKQYQTTQKNDELTDTLMKLLGGGDENESI